MRTFVDEHRAVADDVEAWRRLLGGRGRYLGLTWPRELGGGGRSRLEQVVLAEEFARAGVPTGAPYRQLRHQDVRQHIGAVGDRGAEAALSPGHPPGEDAVVQGYSEPEAGSDLAGLKLRAERDGDEWVLNGQKMWTSRWNEGNWMFVLARTDPDAPSRRHQLPAGGLGLVRR